MIDYQVRLINFPAKAKEAVTKNEDDTYTIFIDASLSKDEQQKRFLHALKHIVGDDFSSEDIQHIEYLAHNLDNSELTLSVLLCSGNS